MNENELKEQKTFYTNLGFRVVMFLDGNADKDVNEGINEVIKNHVNDSSLAYRG